MRFFHRRRRGTFVLFTVLATGMVASTGRRSVVGMLSGAQMAGTISFHAACRFFSSAVWDLDQMGLVAARLIVSRLLPPDEPVTVVAGDTLYKWPATPCTNGGAAIPLCVLDP